MTTLPLDALENTPEFLALTKPQKLCLATYVQSAETPGMTEQQRRILAIRTAYKCKNDGVATVMSYKVFKHPKFAAAFGIHLGKSDKDIFLEEFIDAIRTPGFKLEKLRAMKAYALMKGWVAEAELEVKLRARAEQKREEKPAKKSRRKSKEPEPELYDLSDFEKKDLPDLKVEAPNGNQGDGTARREDSADPSGVHGTEGGGKGF